MKLGSVCHISTLPNTIFPVEMAVDINLIAEGNDVTTEADEEYKYTILLDEGPLPENEENSLHPQISSRCSGSSYSKFTEVQILKKERDALHNGFFVILDSRSSRANCVVRVCDIID